MAVMVLAEHANVEIDVMRTMKMMLIHDIVEIDAGDTLVYDKSDVAGKIGRERNAAVRIFGLLREVQALELHELWIEFEARATPEAKFAASIDRLLPLLHNYHSRGMTWKENNITADQVCAVNAHISQGSESIWEYMKSLIEDAVEKGFLKEKQS